MFTQLPERYRNDLDTDHIDVALRGISVCTNVNTMPRLYQCRRVFEVVVINCVIYQVVGH